MLLRALILASFTLLAACQPSAPQLIFVGGPILTVDPEDRVVEALAVQDGRILATGSRQQILALAGSDSEIVDLHGKTLYTARAWHWSAVDRQAHEEMGFHRGWGESLDRLVALVSGPLED